MASGSPLDVMCTPSGDVKDRRLRMAHGSRDSCHCAMLGLDILRAVPRK
jgi:hypothetical protein